MMIGNNSSIDGCKFRLKDLDAASDINLLLMFILLGSLMGFIFSSCSDDDSSPVTFEKRLRLSANSCSYSLIQSPDEGFFLCGYIDQDFSIIKIDTNGAEEWTKSFLEGCGVSINKTFDSGLVATGFNTSKQGNDFDIHTIKANGQGVQLWSKTIDIGIQDFGYDIQETFDGGYIIGGWSYSDNWDISIIKTDSYGEVEWLQQIGDYQDNWISGIRQTEDGGFIVCANSICSDNDRGICLFKLDEDGNQMWIRHLYEWYLCTSESFNITDDGGYIICGTSRDDDHNILLIKTDKEGAIVWKHIYGGDLEEVGRSVSQTNDGGYIACGTTESYGSGKKDVYLIKTDQYGVETWSKVFGGVEDDYGYDVVEAEDNGFIVCGETYIQSSDSSDIYIIKTDQNGDIIEN